MPAILNAGRDLIAAKQGAGQPLTIDRFILADITGLDHTQAVDLDEAMPAAGDIVYQGAVTQSGYVSLDQVVYSLLLGSTVGPFDFNWVGLQADDDTLVAVSYVPLQQKTATVGQSLGNAITRNFLLAFTDAQATTNITIDAATWQIDFMGRLDDQDERERQSNADIYGEQTFFAGGFRAWSDAGTFKLKPGDGYINGVRINNPSDLTLSPGTLPKDVWLDVSMIGDASGVTSDVQIVYGTVDKSDYVDSLSRQHYLIKVARIAPDGGLTDYRTSYAVTHSVLQFLLDQFNGVSYQGSNDNFEAGTKMLFVQAAAPTGWTKVTDHNNKALRLVSGDGGGEGGAVDFTGAFKSQSVVGSIANTTADGSVTVNNHTMTESESSYSYLYQVRHSSTLYDQSTVTLPKDGWDGQTVRVDSHSDTGTWGLEFRNKTETASGHDHTGSFSGTAHGHSFSGAAIDLAVKYVDAIIAVKD